jgi:hypothetical protein
MKVQRKLLMLIAAMALGAAPAVALAADPGDHPTGPPSTTPPTNQGTAHKPSTPGPNASLPAKAKAYGKDCQDQSKTHVAGTPGTPFSKCVTDMAKLAHGSTDNPRTACKDESKTHVAGSPGTPFSLCVSSGAKLLQSTATGPNASPSAKAKAYGKNCQDQSKTHVAGTPGTPFSKCVTDMAKLANGSTNNPRTACKDESKEHVAGTPGTPFSLCVSSGAKLLKTEHGDS